MGHTLDLQVSLQAPSQDEAQKAGARPCYEVCNKEASRQQCAGPRIC